MQDQVTTLYYQFIKISPAPVQLLWWYRGTSLQHGELVAEGDEKMRFHRLCNEYVNKKRDTLLRHTSILPCSIIV